jgi:hypothetical protein
MKLSFPLTFLAKKDVLVSRNGTKRRNMTVYTSKLKIFLAFCKAQDTFELQVESVGTQASKVLF